MNADGTLSVSKPSSSSQEEMDSYTDQHRIDDRRKAGGSVDENGNRCIDAGLAVK